MFPPPDEIFGFRIEQACTTEAGVRSESRLTTTCFSQAAYMNVSTAAEQEFLAALTLIPDKLQLVES